MKNISNHSIRTAIGLIVIIVLTLNLGQGITKGIQILEKDERDLSLSSLTPHDSISITSDSDFSVFSGTGTAEDPYIIEGYSITTTNYRGIHIIGTTKYFVVRNCYVDAGGYGIYISNVADGTAAVINNTCNNNAYRGIYLQSSGSSTVVNNTCSNNNRYGIYLSSSEYSTVANNTCSNNNFCGIYLLNSGSSTVVNNTCNNNNYWGISLEYSGSSTIVNNTLTNCGLYISKDTVDAYLSYTLENNWVNGKRLGFYTNLDSTIIDEPVYGQLILVNCTNVTIRDQTLSNATTGLFLFSCPYSVIINNTCNNNCDDSIYLESSGSSTVINNTCNNNDWGIRLDSSGSSTIVNNVCSNNYWDGIALLSSSSSIVVNNTCTNNNHCGIDILSSSSSTVANNTCSNNSDGIALLSSSSSTVVNNTCSNNSYDGIYLGFSDFCVVTYNLLQENEEYGVYLRSDSDNNLIHHNTFVGNGLGGNSQAFDECTDNIWYDTVTLEGNYWSDWSGTGTYSIDGSASSEDPYPLDEPAEFTTTEHSSVESTTDENQLNFTVTLLILVVALMLTRIISKKKKK